MPELHYISFVRFPTEKAHGLQIAQNCEAFADMGYDVTLWASTRKNIPEMDAIKDIHAHYGVNSNFVIKRISSIDIYHLANGNPRLEYIAFWVHTISYCLMLILNVFMNKADIYYSRDRYPLIALSLIIPKEKLAFEVHQFAPTDKGAKAQQSLVRRVGHIVAITPKLQEDFINKHRALPEQIMLAHDGIREARFSQLLDKTEARQRVGWEQSAFIVGYMGRLHTMGMDKGVGLLVDASAKIEGVTLALVGGPDDMANQLEQQWLEQGGDSRAFYNAGTVKPDEIPTYLAAFDVCAMPFPWTEHYAYYMSPLKLFEYMASGKAILATDLPSVIDVVTHRETAYIVEPGNQKAIGEGIIALKNDATLRETLGRNAREIVLAKYTWEARARHIKTHLERNGS